MKTYTQILLTGILNYGTGIIGERLLEDAEDASAGGRNGPKKRFVGKSVGRNVNLPSWDKRVGAPKKRRNGVS